MGQWGLPRYFQNGSARIAAVAHIDTAVFAAARLSSVIDMVTLVDIDYGTDKDASTLCSSIQAQFIGKPYLEWLRKEET
jgi:hypothetical protein